MKEFLQGAVAQIRERNEDAKDEAEILHLVADITERRKAKLFIYGVLIICACFVLLIIVARFIIPLFKTA